MDAVIALVLIPFALSGREMIGALWLEASTVYELVTVGRVCPVRVTFLEKDCLDVMIPLIVRTLNPDSFCLIYGWYGHRLPPV
jgi:hypothetical protein